MKLDFVSRVYFLLTKISLHIVCLQNTLPLTLDRTLHNVECQTNIRGVTLEEGFRIANILGCPTPLFDHAPVVPSSYGPGCPWESPVDRPITNDEELVDNLLEMSSNLVQVPLVTCKEDSEVANINYPDLSSLDCYLEPAMNTSDPPTPPDSSNLNTPPISQIPPGFLSTFHPISAPAKSESPLPAPIMPAPVPLPAVTFSSSSCQVVQGMASLAGQVGASCQEVPSCSRNGGQASACATISPATTPSLVLPFPFS